MKSICIFAANLPNKPFAYMSKLMLVLSAVKIRVLQLNVLDG